MSVTVTIRTSEWIRFYIELYAGKTAAKRSLKKSHFDGVRSKFHHQVKN